MAFEMGINATYFFFKEEWLEIVFEDFTVIFCFTVIGWGYLSQLKD